MFLSVYQFDTTVHIHTLYLSLLWIRLIFTFTWFQVELQLHQHLVLKSMPAEENSGPYLTLKNWNKFECKGSLTCVKMLSVCVLPFRTMGVLQNMSFRCLQCILALDMFGLGCFAPQHCCCSPVQQKDGDLCAHFQTFQFMEFPPPSESYTDVDPGLHPFMVVALLF